MSAAQAPRRSAGVGPNNPGSQRKGTTIGGDREQLELLTILHYVFAGATALFGCFPIIHLSLGVAMLSGALDSRGGAPPMIVGWMFIILPAVMMVGFWTLAVLALFAGRMLAARQAHTYCLVVAAIECLFMPLGTALGVFTIIVLVRPSVKQMFGVETPEESRPSEASEPTPQSEASEPSPQ